jgi:glyoxylase-like metal-dependent hydrolase (beta-lactamase superfamily II)
MGANCYIVSDNKTSGAFLIDPGGDPDKIKSVLKKNGLALKFIINTHGHGDHIAANNRFDTPVYIHRLDKDFLADPEKNLSGMFGLPMVLPQADRLLEDGEVIPFAGASLEILHTPGHTPGSISIKTAGTVFTGDALFAGGIGRTDFSYGDEKLLLESIKKRLLVLDDAVTVHPGHGESSTIGEERRSNPFLC